MPLTIDASLRTLSGGARSKGADERTVARLADVQEFLARELLEVEQALALACAAGPEPATAAARHLVARGGKRVRPLALLLSAKCFGDGSLGAASSGQLIELAAVVELVHSATLLHDDVVDEGMQRRGAITARRLLGNGVSVLAGDLLLVTALERTGSVAPALLPDLIGTLRRLVEGEIIQLRGRTELDVSESTYYRILKDKTASLFGFAARAGGQLAGASLRQQEALTRFGEALGVAFQLVDDVIDYTGDDSGKNLFADLGEGKLTLPLVLAVRDDPTLAPLLAGIHAGDASLCEEVGRRVRDSGCCDRVRERARAETDAALSALGELPVTAATRLLEVVAREMIRRAA
jgi:octaprenyl-diphosphate synthase